MAASPPHKEAATSPTLEAGASSSCNLNLKDATVRSSSAVAPCVSRSWDFEASRACSACITSCFNSDISARDISTARRSSPTRASFALASSAHESRAARAARSSSRSSSSSRRSSSVGTGAQGVSAPSPSAAACCLSAASLSAEGRNRLVATASSHMCSALSARAVSLSTSRWNALTTLCISRSLPASSAALSSRQRMESSARRSRLSAAAVENMAIWTRERGGGKATASFPPALLSLPPALSLPPYLSSLLTPPLSLCLWPPWPR
eukprot:scaffold54883_cov31-Tisochrysis_lutea.AAC.1